MSPITKIQMIIAAFAFASLFVGGLASINMEELNVFANKKSNTASQVLPQDQLSEQSSEVFSENGTSTASGNNVDLSFSLNEGQNTLGQ